MILLGKKEQKKGRAQGLTGGSKGVWKVHVFSCAPQNVYVWQLFIMVADVTGKGKTILRCVEVWESAVQVRIEGRQSSGGVQGVKRCVDSARPHVLNSLHPL